MYRAGGETRGCRPGGVYCMYRAGGLYVQNRGESLDRE